MIKCIHTGDLHLGTRFKNASFVNYNANFLSKRRVELWQTFEKIVDRAKKTCVDFLFFAGDLFEDKYFTIGDIKRIKSKLEQVDSINIVISTGNHDILGKNSLYKCVKWPDNVYIFNSDKISKKEFPELNTVVWGYSWYEKECKKELFSNFKIEDNNKINILLIHGDILNKKSNYLSMDKTVLQNKGFDYIALGHIHKPQFIGEKICYCGSPEPLNFGELGVHGIVEGTIDKNRINMKFVTFNKRSFFEKEIKIDENMNYQDIIHNIKTCDSKQKREKNFYRVILKGIRDRYICLDTEELRETMLNNFYYIEIIDDTIPDLDLKKLEKENESNIIGYFIRDMKNKNLNNKIIKDALYEGLKVLLEEKEGK